MKKQTTERDARLEKADIFGISCQNYVLWFFHDLTKISICLSGTFSLQPLLIFKHILAIPKNQQSLYST